jgi:hypothetical protein
VFTGFGIIPEKPLIRKGKGGTRRLESISGWFNRDAECWMLDARQRKAFKIQHPGTGIQHPVTSIQQRCANGSVPPPAVGQRYGAWLGNLRFALYMRVFFL